MQRGSRFWVSEVIIVRFCLIRAWFAVAAAVIAAALADPCVEALSNAGLFGPGRFTDQSNLDVLPALCVGVALGFACLAMRVRRELARESSIAVREHVMHLLPAVFVVQIGVLALMETLEQIVVYGHTLGGTIWLGGPANFSVFAHAVACVLVSVALSALLRVLARHTARAIRLMRALAERSLHPRTPLAVRRWEHPGVRSMAPVRCRIGNRAPPIAIA